MRLRTTAILATAACGLAIPASGLSQQSTTMMHTPCPPQNPRAAWPAAGSAAMARTAVGRAAMVLRRTGSLRARGI